MTIYVKSEPDSKFCYEVKVPDPDPEDIACISGLNHNFKDDPCEIYIQRVLERLKNYLSFGYYWSYKEN